MIIPYSHKPSCQRNTSVNISVIMVKYIAHDRSALVYLSVQSNSNSCWHSFLASLNLYGHAIFFFFLSFMSNCCAGGRPWPATDYSTTDVLLWYFSFQFNLVEQHVNSVLDKLPVFADKCNGFMKEAQHISAR